MVEVEDGKDIGVRHDGSRWGGVLEAAKVQVLAFEIADVDLSTMLGCR